MFSSVQERMTVADRLKVYALCMFCVYIMCMLMITEDAWTYQEYKLSRYSSRELETQIPLLTLFTTWNSKMENAVIYNNTMHLWPSLHPSVRVVLFSDENATNTNAVDLGWHLQPLSKKKCEGTPVLKDMFLNVQEKYKSTFYAYSNGDILYDKGLIDTLHSVKTWMSTDNNPVLISGKRIALRLDVHGLLEKAPEIILRIGVLKGTIDHGYAEDYFIVSKNFEWDFFPDLVIGRPVVDNHLIATARENNVTVIDASSSILAIHQKTKSRIKYHNVCNKNILQEINRYDMKLLRTGNVECAHFETRYNRNGSVQIFKRGQFTTKCVK